MCICGSVCDSRYMYLWNCVVLDMCDAYRLMCCLFIAAFMKCWIFGILGVLC